MSDAKQPSTSTPPPPGTEEPPKTASPEWSAGWRHTELTALAIHGLALLVVLNGGLALYAFHEVAKVRRETERSLLRTEMRFQSLDSQITFDSNRRHLLAGIRDEILRARPNLSVAAAYEYAELALQTSEKYTQVDPLLLVAIGVVESQYDTDAVSHAGARGLYQIIPATGRMLGQALDWPYSDEMLHDPAVSTEMAALYLEILMAAYNDIELVLAEYNGGPMNAGYFRASASRLASETKAYVPKVMDVYGRLRRELRGEASVATQGLRHLRVRSRDRIPTRGPASLKALLQDQAVSQTAE